MAQFGGVGITDGGYGTVDGGCWKMRHEVEELYCL